MLTSAKRGSRERLPTEIGLRENWNVLSIRTVAIAPDFRILLYAFRAGDPLPATAWDAGRTAVSVEFPEQRDVIRSKASAAGKTHLMVSRGGEALVKLIRPVAPLNDPESDALTQRLRQIPDSWPSSMLSSWTHLAFTFDGKQLCAYRNGLPISSVPSPEGGRFGWGRRFSLGGRSPYGDAEVTAQSIYFYNTAMAPEAVEDLYLWGKYGPVQAEAR